MSADEKPTDCCSFCGKVRKDVKFLVAGLERGTFICDESVLLVLDIGIEVGDYSQDDLVDRLKNVIIKEHKRAETVLSK